MASLEILASIITLIYWYLVFFRSLGSRSNSNCISNYPLGLFKVLPGNVITLGSCDVLYNFIFCEYSCIIYISAEYLFLDDTSKALAVDKTRTVIISTVSIDDTPIA